MALAWAARRDSSRRLPWAWPLLWARLRSATFTAPPEIRVRPRARLGVASAGSATRNRSRSRANKTSCIVAYDMVLISCWTLSGRFASPATIVSDCASVRMTGLIAATSPLPESAAFHNCVVQATRGCAARPCERSAELASGRPSSMHGEFLRVPGYRQSSSGLRPATRMGQVTYALREPNSARRSKLRDPMLPKWGHKSSQQIRLPARPGIMTASEPFLPAILFDAPSVRGPRRG